MDYKAGESLSPLIFVLIPLSRKINQVSGETEHACSDSGDLEMFSPESGWEKPEGIIQNVWNVL